MSEPFLSDRAERGCIGWGARTGRRPGFILVVAFAAVLGASCSATEPGNVEEVRLGYFANLTHAPALVGLAQGFFQEELDNVVLRPARFNAGPDAITAMFTGAVDLTFIGPNPAINGFAQSNGEALRIVSGVTSGGAALVVRPGLSTPQDLMGRRLATPQLGNTQDVALRAWLLDQGLSVDIQGGGQVAIVPQDNAQILQVFVTGDIDGAWVPEPWATRLVLEAGGEVLVDERDLWPDGQFVTTHLIVRAEFLQRHPDVVRALLRGLVRSIDFIEAESETARAIVSAEIERIAGTTLSAEVVEGAWAALTFTVDPIASSLRQVAEDAVRVGLLSDVDLDGIYDLTLLNEVLAEMGRTPVES